MSLRARLHAAAFCALAISVAGPTGAAAPDYPNRPIRLIIPFPPGGGSDVTGRVVAQALGERLGTPLVVDNRAGAGGIIGTEMAANASRDGHTLLVVSLAHVITPWLYDLKGRYDPIRSFAPVAVVAASPIVLVANPGVPVKSVAELLAFARKHPGKLQYASAGVGSVSHLAAELFNYSARVNMLHVPYKGAGAATVDVVAGHANLTFGGLLATVPHVRAGRLRALGVGSLQRNPVLPDVPSIAEAGVPDYETVNWFGLVAPAGTPDRIIDRLSREIAVVQEQPELRRQLDTDGATVLRMTPAQFGAYMAADMAKWGRVVKAGAIRAN